MTARFGNQPVVGTKVALAPAAIAALLGAALLAGGLLGIGAKAAYDSLSANQATTQVATSSVVSSAPVRRASQIALGRGPLVRDSATAVSRPRTASHAVDHIGLIERLFPVSTRQRIQHGPLP